MQTRIHNAPPAGRFISWGTASPASTPVHLPWFTRIRGRTDVTDSQFLFCLSGQLGFRITGTHLQELGACPRWNDPDFSSLWKEQNSPVRRSPVPGKSGIGGKQIRDVRIDLQELIGETTRSSMAQTEIDSFAARAREMHAPCSENGRIEP